MSQFSKIVVGWLIVLILCLVGAVVYQLQQPPPPTPQEILKDLKERADQGDVAAASEICINHPEVNFLNLKFCRRAAEHGDKKSAIIYKKLLKSQF